MDVSLQALTGLNMCFIEHLSALNSDIQPAACQMLWQDIAGRYCEGPRTYHTLHHLKQLFTQFDHIKKHLQQPNIIALALYYHDVIYDPTRTDNEEKSAEYAVDKLRTYLNTEQCKCIHALIMMTANHQLDKIAINSFDNDAAYLLDMDLSILGSTWDEYQHYAQAVRQEYKHVDSASYRSGRIEILRGLLAHPKLYLTEDYHRRLEQQARINIQREISILSEQELA